MQKNLLENVSAKLRELDRGGYARTYRKSGRGYPSRMHQLVAQVLDSLAIEYETGVPIYRGAGTKADFMIGDRLILIEKRISPAERKRVEREGRSCIFMSRSKTRSDGLDDGIRVVETWEEGADRLQTIFLDDPSFNFDYAHILPKTQKCSVMHGHTSSVLVEVMGTPKDGMVVDFNDAKPIIREAVRELDHKLFINNKYVTGEDGDFVALAFETVHGRFEMKVPKKTTVLLEGEATVENLAQELLGRIAPGMPRNVESVGVYVYEGLNKGTHLLAQVHRREAERSRKR